MTTWVAWRPVLKKFNTRKLNFQCKFQISGCEFIGKVFSMKILILLQIGRKYSRATPKFSPSPENYTQIGSTKYTFMSNTKHFKLLKLHEQKHWFETYANSETWNISRSALLTWDSFMLDMNMYQWASSTFHSVGDKTGASHQNFSPSCNNTNSKIGSQTPIRFWTQDS